MLGGLISFLVVGAIAGWLAGKITKGEGFGLIGNLITGCIGSLVGGLLFWVLGLATTNIIGAIVAAVIGAVVFLFAAGEWKKRQARLG